MDIFLQIWGGGFYLTNKVFFALAEGKTSIIKRRFKIIGWVIYILGVPAWVIILSLKKDWIAASIEFGGIPAMLFGLYNIYKNTKYPNQYLDIIASLFTCASILLGVGFSLYSHHGITSMSQVLELGVMIGFLLGSYFMAKSKSYGWIFFMLMNVSMGTLMLIQHKPILSIQQFVSLCFVIYGYWVAIKIEKARNYIISRC
jgi:hypothetical protein